MHDPERGALIRAAVILLVVSVVRWAASVGHGEPVVPPAGPSVLEDHAVATDSAATEEERRSQPLEEGERIDPNRASEVELDRLPGVGPATASAIVRARDSAAFSGPTDLLRVRGIGPATLERIRGSIRVSRGGTRSGGGSTASRAPGRTPPPTSGRSRVTRGSRSPPIDVNRADVETLQQLPGIGPALAQRIVRARAERPFLSVDELQRVRGIGPATLARLRGSAVAGARRRDRPPARRTPYRDEACT